MATESNMWTKTGGLLVVLLNVPFHASYVVVNFDLLTTCGVGILDDVSTDENVVINLARVSYK